MFNDLLKEKDARLTEKDARLTDKDKMLNEKDLRLVALQAGLDSATDQRLCEVAHFKLVYELRDMFDWLLRSLYPTARTRPGAIFNTLIDELLDEGKVNLNAAAKERYNELALQFHVGQYEPSSLQDLRGLYKVLKRQHACSVTWCGASVMSARSPRRVAVQAARRPPRARRRRRRRVARPAHRAAIRCRPTSTSRSGRA